MPGMLHVCENCGAAIERRGKKWIGVAWIDGVKKMLGPDCGSGKPGKHSPGHGS